MPKIRQTYVSKPTGDGTIDVVIYYFNEGEYDHTKFFLVTPVDTSYLLTEHDLLKRGGRGQNQKRGTTGATETEALSNFSTYLEDYNKRMTTRKEVILIEKQSSDRTQYYGEREDKLTTEVEIKFEYIKAYILTVKDKEYFYKDSKYHGLHNDDRIHNPDIYTIIPYSEQALNRCELIVQQFSAIQERIYKLFQTPESAQTTLLTTPNLLTQ